MHHQSFFKRQAQSCTCIPNTIVAYILLVLVATTACGDGLSTSSNAHSSSTTVVPTTGSVSTTVTGSGSVTSSPPGVNCASSGGAACFADFPIGSYVTLTAAPSGGASFSGWGGACSGTSTTCSLTIGSISEVSAGFSIASTDPVQVEVESGDGCVVSNPAGINVCRPGIDVQTANFTSGSVITLTATASPARGFLQWGGAASSCGTLLVCKYTVTSGSAPVLAMFTSQPFAPSFTSANTYTFDTGAANSFTITATGVPLPAIYESAALPARITFTQNGAGIATLSGTAATGSCGAYPLTLTASNGISPDAIQYFTLNIYQLPAFTSALTASFITGMPGSFTATATGCPSPTLTVSSGSIPPGMTFTAGSNGTAIISGTPTTPGTFMFTLTAASSAGTISQPMTFIVSVGAASTPFTLNAVQPPTTTSDTNYAAWESVLATAASQPIFTGGTIEVNDGCSANCGRSTYVDYGSSCPWLTYNDADAVVQTYTSVGKFANIIQAASVEGGTNTGTPTYVYTQDWANFLDLSCSGMMNPALTYTVGAVYRPLWYVYANGAYWQMTGTAADPDNPAYRIGCQAFAEPAFIDAHGPYTEAGPFPCTWAETPNHGAQAPPQDVICSADFEGSNCYRVPVTSATLSGGTATLTVTDHTFSIGNSVEISISDSAFNGTFTLTGVTTTTVSYALPGIQSPETVTGTAAGSHLLNINTPNAIAAMLASGLPVAYEEPYALYRQYLCDQTIQHYNAGQLNGGYIVCGYEGGGEYSTFDIRQQPMYGSATQFRAIWLSGISDFLQNQAAQNPDMPLFGDMNAVNGDYIYTDQECKMEAANNIGCRNNGLQASDIINIICSQGVSSAYCTAMAPPKPCDNPPVSNTLGCTSGGWYRNIHTYPTMANGKPTPLSLQTKSGSTQNCSAENTGPLGTVPAGSPFCTNGFIGLVNGLVALRQGTLGPVEETVTNLELYTNPPANCWPSIASCEGDGTYPIGDLLLALDPAYTRTTDSQTAVTYLTPIYQAAFANFLQGPGATLESSH